MASTSVKFKTFPQAGIEFDDYETIEGDTRLYVTPDGNFPSMTSLLKQLDDGGIDKWKKRVGKAEAEKVVNEATSRGNSLHDLNELYLLNKLKREDVKGPGRILFNRVRHYLDEIDLVVGTEVALYNKDDGYAGRADALVMMGDDIMVLDHKNSRRPIDTKKDYARKKLLKYMIQCCGYRRALYKMKGIWATKGCIIVGNHMTSTADRFIFDLDHLDPELDIIIHAYYNAQAGIKNSMYFQL